MDGLVWCYTTLGILDDYHPHRYGRPMMHRNALVILVGVALFGFAVRCPAPLIFTPGEGWRWEPVGGGTGWQKGRAKDQLEVAQKAFEQKDYSLAMKAARRVVTQWPYSSPTFTSQARYIMGRCYEEKGQDEKAFKMYQNLITRHPTLPNYDEVVQRQYIIANRYLAGQWFKLWGVVPAFPSMSRTIRMYDQIITNGPYSSVAPASQMKIAQAYENKYLPNYPGAALAYERAADRYSDTEVGTDALFKKGEAYTKQAKRAEYDQSIAGQAIASFTDFTTLNPADARVPKAQDYVTSLKTEQARGNFDIAKFYEKNRRWKGALIYYNEVVATDASSKFADEARQRIDAIQRKRLP